MSKPTQEQLTQFWKWCGFKPKEGYSNCWEAPSNKRSLYARLPAVDLNNLFKWAVPKVYAMDNFWLIDYQLTGLAKTIPTVSAHSWSILFSASHETDDVTRESVGDDPALALFWAIWQVIE